MGKERGRRAQKAQKEAEEAPALETPQEIPTTFFGLVDSHELEYFKQAESTLNVNAFESDEEKTNFIFGVLEEARGKELKLVTNQICSKLFERLILDSTDLQLKDIFKAFSGHFLQLCFHKYSSHCLETLLVRCAALIEKEMLGNTVDVEEEMVSMENLFLFMLGELKPSIKVMIAHPYGSHVLRLIMLIVSGKNLPSSIMSNSILRSKKSKIARKMIEIGDNSEFGKVYQIPSSFKDELSEILSIIVAKETTKSMREYAIHKVASPVIQLCIQLEGLVGKERPCWHLVFEKGDEKDPQEESFVEYLLSDPIGSHFLQAVTENQRVKLVERLFRLYMKERVLKLAKREKSASFVVQTLLTKLKPSDINDMLDELVPSMNELLVNNLEMGQTIISASANRRDYLKPEIVDKLVAFFTAPQNKDDVFVENLLRLKSSTLGNTRDDWPTADERRRSIFLEKLVSYDDRFLEITVNSLLENESDTLQMCKHGVFSHVVESVLCRDRLKLVTRKRILNLLVDNVVDLACNAYGSHIVDKMWDFSHGLTVYKDRIASKLVGSKDVIKESVYGKLVWKNWKMELFLRKKYDWYNLIKEQEGKRVRPVEHEQEPLTKRRQ